MEKGSSKGEREVRFPSSKKPRSWGGLAKDLTHFFCEIGIGSGFSPFPTADGILGSAEEVSKFLLGPHALFASLDQADSGGLWRRFQELFLLCRTIDA